VKNFLLKSLGSLFAKAGFEVLGKITGSEAFAANLALRIVWSGWGVFKRLLWTLRALFKSRA
jgi:hypothetical protein